MLQFLFVPSIYLTSVYFLYNNKDTIIFHCNTNQSTYDSLKKTHNYLMATISFINIILTTYITYNNNKFSSLNDLICKPYDDSMFLYINSLLFLLSKIFELIDTFF